MVRRKAALLWTTLAVLAAHGLALLGLPLQPLPSTPAPGPVFSTRTLSAPAPAVPVAAPAAPAAAPPPPAPPPRRVRPRPKALPPTADPAPVVALDWAVPAIEPIEPADTPAPTEEAPPAPTAAPEPEPEPAPAPPAPTPVPAVASAIDITPPGALASDSPGSAAPPVRIPPPMRLQFDVSGQAKGFQYRARAELLWQHDGTHYQARQEVSALFLGSRTQSSVGDIGTGGLLPQRFGDRARSERAAHFDYGQGRITFSANTPEAPLLPGTQDRLSVFLQLGALLAAEPGRYPAGTHIRIATAGTRDVDTWAFTVEGEETLELPAGTLPTLKLQRLPRRDHDQKAELWLAPQLGYLPARIRLTQANGDFADLRLNGHGAP